MNNIKNLTRGAVIAALYIVLILIYRFTSEADFCFLIFPLPILIYYKVSNFKWAALCEAVVLVLSFFVVGNVYSWIGLVVSNLVASFIFLICLNKIKNKTIGFILIFLTYIFVETFSLFFTNYFVSNITIENYINLTVDEFAKFIPSINKTLILKSVYIALPISFIIFALMKIIINYLVYYMVSIRLNLINKDEFKLRFIYSKLLVIIYLIFLIILLILSYYFINLDNLLIYIIYVSIFALFSIISLYFLLQGSTFLKVLKPDMKPISSLILIIILVIFFPIGIILGMISNFKLR